MMGQKRGLCTVSRKKKKKLKGTLILALEGAVVRPLSRQSVPSIQKWGLTGASKRPAWCKKLAKESATVQGQHRWGAPGPNS